MIGARADVKNGNYGSLEKIYKEQDSIEPQPIDTSEGREYTYRGILNPDAERRFWVTKRSQEACTKVAHVVYKKDPCSVSAGPSYMQTNRYLLPLSGSLHTRFSVPGG